MSFIKNNITKVVFSAAFLLMVLPQPVDKREKSPERLIASIGKKGSPGSAADSQMLIYTRVRDSLERLVNWQKTPVIKKPNLLSLDVTRLNEGDSAGSTVSIPGRLQSFFTIKGVVLRPHSDFIIENGQYILKRYNTPLPGDSSVYAGREKINVRLSYEEPGDKGLNLMIPVSDGLYSLLKTIMDIFTWILLIASAVCFIYLPLRVLDNIARGKPFIPQNSKYLYLLGWGVLAFSLLKVVIPYLLSVLLSSRIPPDIYFPFWSAVFEEKGSLFVGLGILITAEAFNQSYRLKQENDIII